MTFSRTVSALLAALAIAVGPGGVCAGWMPTAEARMACCSENGACPMHDSESGAGTPTHVTTQADADRCCAASGQDDSAPPQSTVAFSVVPALASRPVSSLAPDPQVRVLLSRTSGPILESHVPRHVLLSVFLV